MYSLSQKVTISSAGRFKGTKGTIVEIFPQGEMDDEIVYMVEYIGILSNGKGMFKHSELVCLNN